MVDGAQCAVIAHRGASHEHPDNTVEAFRAAHAMGADWVELDARRTADGTIAVHHDAHLADGRAVVGLGRVDLPDPVLSLADALDACAPMGVNVEIKNSPPDPDFDPHDRVTDVVLDLLDHRGDRDRVLISSFNWPTIARVRERAPGIATGWLVEIHLPDRGLELAAGAGHEALHPEDGLVGRELVTAAHDHGLAVNVWVVDDPARMDELIAWGVDGICTNKPDLARAVIG